MATAMRAVIVINIMIALADMIVMMTEIARARYRGS